MTATDRAQLLIHWLSVLNNGRVRPDDPSVAAKKLERDGKEVDHDRKPCCNETGVIRDSWEFKIYIDAINKDLAENLDLTVR